MGYRCSGCGYRSDHRGFFRRERTWRGLRTYCEVCDYTPLDSSEWAVIGTVILYLVLAVGGLAASAGDGGAGWGWVNLFLLGMVVSAPATIAVHELGHALAARLVGHALYEVHIGGGGPLFRRYVGGVEWIMRRNLGQAGHVMQYELGDRPSRWRDIVVFAGGALGNLAAAVAAFGLYALIMTVLDPDEWGLPQYVGFTLFLAFMADQLAGVAYNLWPRAGNDGAHIWALLFKPFDRDARRRTSWMFQAQQAARIGRFREALALCDRILAEDPRDLNAAAARCGYLSQLHGPRAGYEAALAAIALEGHPVLHAMAAADAVECDDPALLPEARRLADLAVAEAPGAYTEAVLGMVLIAQGDAAAGAPKVRRLQRESEYAGAKGAYCVHMVRAERALGRPAMAAEYAALEAHLLALVEREYGWRPTVGLFAKDA